MINPTQEDIGREVIYHKAHPKGAPIVIDYPDYGRITSFNDAYVFVRYHTGDTSAATLREDLEWAHPRLEDTNVR